MQTAIQNNNAIRVGSVKLEVGADLGSMVNVGALRGVSWKQKGTTDEIVFDNTQKIKKFSDGDLFAIVATLCEIEWDNIQAMNDGQVTVTNIAGSLVAGEEQTVASGAWAYNKFIKIEHQNGDGSAITVNSVTGGTDGALVEDTDFYVGQNELGQYGIFVLDTVDVTTLVQSIVIDYDYTPNASKKITFNATGQKIGKYLRITNTDENGKTIVFVLSGGSNISPIEISFASDNEANVSEMPIELEGYMVDITDEQTA